MWKGATIMRKKILSTILIASLVMQAFLQVGFASVVAKTSNGTVLKDKIKINNMADENSSNLKLDIGDTDGDKLANYEEDIFGTDKTKPDTDGDGLTDYEEVKITNTNPLKADTDGNGINDGDEDFDKDGLTNIEEVRLNGNPYSKDTDFDGLDDKTEARLGTKLDQLDSDNDGFSDKEEVDLGTDPLKPNVKGKK